MVAFADTLGNKCAEYSVEDVASSSCLLLLETRPMPRAWICTVRWEAHGRRTDKKERARISLSIYFLMHSHPTQQKQHAIGAAADAQSQDDSNVVKWAGLEVDKFGLTNRPRRFPLVWTKVSHS